MKDIYNTSFIFILSFLLLFFSFLSYAQDEQITTEMVEALRGEIQRDTSLSDEVKNSAEKMLNDILTFIQSINNWNTKLEQLNQEITKAPAEIKSNEDFVSTPPKSEQPKITNLSIDEINQNLIQSETDYKQKQNEFDIIYKDFTNRNEYRKSLTARISEIKKQIDNLNSSGGTIPSQDPPSIQKVKQLLTQAQILALRKELDYLTKELDSFDLKTNLISSRLEKIQIELREKEKNYKFWENEFNKKKQEEIQKNIQNSLDLIKSLTKTGPTFTDELAQLAQENLKLVMKSREPDGIENKLNSLNEKYKEYGQEYKKQKEQLESLQQKSVTKASGSGWAFTLRQEKSKLPNIKEIKSQRNSYNDELLLTENEYNDLLEKRLKISNIENQLWNSFNQFTANLSEFEKKNIRKTIDDLIKTQKNILSTLIIDYENYISLLNQVIEILDSWIKQTYDFKNFIEENIIWIRSPFPRLTLIKSELPKIYSSLSNIQFYLLDEPIKVLLFITIGILGLIILVVFNRLLEKQLQTVSNQIKIPLNFGFGKLFRFIYLLLTKTIIIPLWFLLLAIFLNILFENLYPISVISNSLLLLIPPLIFLDVIFTIIKVPSLGEIVIKDNLIGLTQKFRVFGIWVIINLFILILCSQLIADYVIADLIFRIAFSIFLLSCASLCTYIAFYLKRRKTEDKTSSKNLTANYISNCLITVSFIFVSLVISNFIGYNYGSLEITKKLFFSFFIILLLFLIYRVLELGLNYYKWKSVLKTSIETHSTLLRSSSPIERDAEKSEIEPQKVVFRHIEKLIQYIVVAVGLVITIYIWSDIFPAMSYLDKIHLWRSSIVTTVMAPTNPQATSTNTEQANETPSTIEEWVSLLDLILFILIILTTFIMVKNISFYMDFLLTKYTSIQQGERYAITTITKYILFTIGLFLSLGQIGITWSKVQWLVAGLGIGFGFGLQEIVANFISGIILLFERPVRIGDIVTIGNISGKVKSLQMRSTTIVNWDNKELIVPNKDLLTQQLINWTRNEPIIRLCIPVGVSYQSDVNKVVALLTEIGQSHPLVETEPQPRAYFIKFGPSALEFELRVYTHSSYYLDLQHDLLCTICNRFREENIEISYPQLDVHIRDYNGVLKEKNEKENPKDINSYKYLKDDTI